MNPAEQLKDIRGLDAISFWPLAPGWWLLLLLGVAFLYGLYWLRQRYRPAPWVKSARRQIKVQQQRLQQGEVVANRDILLLLRRIALARAPRVDVASLQGEPWLAWLRENDPRSFDWGVYRQELIVSQYQPGEPAPWSEERGQQVLAALYRWTRSRCV